MGEVMGDLSSRRGHIAGIEPRPPNQVVRALVPLATCSATRPTSVENPGSRQLFDGVFALRGSCLSHVVDRISSARPRVDGAGRPSHSQGGILINPPARSSGGST